MSLAWRNRCGGWPGDRRHEVKNITLAVDERLVEKGRRYAREHHTSLNSLIRELLARTVGEAHDGGIDDCLRKMDAARGHSRGRKWRRQDLYDA